MSQKVCSIFLNISESGDREEYNYYNYNVNNNNFYSPVVQKAFIEVNEDGTEAAAATAGVMMMRAMVMNPSFTCDRPFMFMIKDNLTGVTLFSGHVTDPTSQ